MEKIFFLGGGEPSGPYGANGRGGERSVYLGGTVQGLGYDALLAIIELITNKSQTKTLLT